ncbi:hypothetical protein FRB99_007457 [Tulasnella sp. 403]|nr:hypothetical protein FRB99_007457 [Tulasnella sp. 403]
MIPVTSPLFRSYGDKPRDVVLKWYGQSFPKSPKDRRGEVTTQLVNNLWKGHWEAFQQWEQDSFITATYSAFDLPPPDRSSSSPVSKLNTITLRGKALKESSRGNMATYPRQGSLKDIQTLRRKRKFEENVESSGKENVQRKKARLVPLTRQSPAKSKGTQRPERRARLR